jgi:hypothetical protein
MEWALLVVAVGVVLAVVLLRGAKGQPQADALSREANAVPHGMTAAEMLRRVAALDPANAQWPEIWAQLNPDGDPAVQQLLIDFRGPYLFAPHAAINVLRIGCERALAASPTADRVAAIRAAMQADDQVVRPR